jgi:hypothetical protein
LLSRLSTLVQPLPSQQVLLIFAAARRQSKALNATQYCHYWAGVGFPASVFMLAEPDLLVSCGCTTVVMAALAGTLAPSLQRTRSAGTSARRMFGRSASLSYTC